jgi:hypothetical protein
MFRRHVAGLLLGAAVISLSAHAEPAKRPAADADPAARQLVEKQQALLRQYKAIAEDLITLAQRLEKSNRVEDQEKAKLIRKAIDLGDKEGVDSKFATLLRTLAGNNGILGIKDITAAKTQNEELVKVLKGIIAILMSDDDLLTTRRERERLEKLVAILRALIRDTKVTRVLTEMNKAETTKLHRGQTDLARRTDYLAERMGAGKDPKEAPALKTPGADHVRKAVPDQEAAGERIKEEKRPMAVVKQSDAIVKMEEALKELEKRLKQLREEELQKILANLEARVAKMLQMQIEVYEATKAIDAVVRKSESKKPEKADIQKSQVQADKEGDIIAEANAALDILKNEGSAVAFPRIFEEVVIDMVSVKERLNAAKVGSETQFIEEQIIDALREMHAALQLAQRPPGPPSPPGPPGDPGPPPDQKLLDEIAELKMLRSMQVRVNERTKRQGNLVQSEQADDPQIKDELRNLANRQAILELMTRDLAEKRNK